MRLDVAAIALISYLIGIQLSGRLSLQDVLTALLVCFISTNSVYSLNAWADAEIDCVNKPHRPIPAGLITRRAALRYAIGLLVLAFVFPFFVARSWLTLILFLVIPFLGITYSVPMFGVRRHAVFGVFLTSLGLLLPIQLGYLMSARDYRHWAFFVVLFAFIVSVVTLKDIEDVEGDVQFGADNLFVQLGNRLFWVCKAGLTATVLLTIVLPIRSDLKLFLYAAAGGAIIVTIFVKPIQIIYRTIIQATIVSGLLLFLFLFHTAI